MSTVYHICGKKATEDRAFLRGLLCVSKNKFFDTLRGCLKTAGARKPPPSAYMVYARAGAICVCKLRQEDDIGFLQMTQTAKAGVSQKRPSYLLNSLLILFRRNALLRPADFFDSLRKTAQKCAVFL